MLAGALAAIALAGICTHAVSIPAPVGIVKLAPDMVMDTPEKIALAGTLTEPCGAGPWPAAVLASESQASDNALAQALARAGVAVLRADPRGRGTSTGAATDALDPTWRDLEAEARFLAGRSEIDRLRIGVVGAGAWAAAALVDEAAAGEARAFLVAVDPKGWGTEAFPAREFNYIQRSPVLVMIAKLDDRQALAAGLRNDRDASIELWPELGATRSVPAPLAAHIAAWIAAEMAAAQNAGPGSRARQ